MGDHNARLALVRAHLECARQGYAVHVSCLGECTWREDTEDYDCHRCEKRVPFGSVCDPPGNDYYESDVAFLLDLIEAERRANAHAIAELCGQVNALRDPEPGQPIGETHCPNCGADLEIEHGDEPGQIAVVGCVACQCTNESGSKFCPIHGDPQEEINGP